MKNSDKVSLTKKVDGDDNLYRVAATLRDLQYGLNNLFPERESLIAQLVYGLLTREHIIVFGPKGTGKTLLVKTFFGAFDDSELFRIEFDKFMTKSDVFGIPNPKIMRDTGKIVHDEETTLLGAQFADLGEFLDANGPLSRALLGTLNEREVSLGGKIVKIDLHTAVASTNEDPEEQIKLSNGKLDAVIDRFLFQTQVDYVKEKANRLKMHSNYVNGASLDISIPYQDIVAISDMVTDVPFDEEAFIELHHDIVSAYQGKTRQEFSDRRTNKALDLVRANAILYGRQEIVPEDFLAEMWVFCGGNDKKALKTFQDVANPLITKAKESMKPSMVETQMNYIKGIEARISETVLDKDLKEIANDPAKLVSKKQSLVAVLKELKSIQPSHTRIKTHQKKLIALIEAKNAEAGRIIDGVPA
ncbi:AAA family ATPase [Patescibacteria group bacterium]